MKRSAFLVRMSSDGYYEVAIGKGLAVIGWSELSELANCDAPTPSEKTEKIKTVLRNSKWYNERGVGNVAGSLYRFIYEIKDGDYIIYPRDKGFHVGVVDAEGAQKATYDDSLRLKDCAWNWKVNWIKQENGSLLLIPRNHLEASLTKTMKFKGTCLKLNDIDFLELEKAMSRKSPPTVGGSLKSDNGILNSVVSVLQRVLTSDRLEKLIKKMLELEGAHVIRYRTGKQGSAGDVDLQATFRISFCGTAKESDEVIYAYQVKNHVGKSDSIAVKQLVDRFESEDIIKYTKGIAITTGKFDQSAIDLKDKFNSGRERHGKEIILLNGEDLAKWVVDLGLASLEEFEAKESNSI